ncbi:unnamed protein product, partial [Owenia fusiformis]
STFTCSYNAPWKIFTDTKLINQTALNVISGQTALGCATFCFLDDRCTSFNLETSTDQCELLKGERFHSLGNDKLAMTDWQLYVINCQFFVTSDISATPGCSNICEKKGVWKNFASAYTRGSAGSDWETTDMWEKLIIEKND